MQTKMWTLPIMMAMTALLFGGCATYISYCEAETDCISDGSQLDSKMTYDVCMAAMKILSDTAQQSACVPLFNEYVACMEAESTCEGSSYTDNGVCQQEMDWFDDCVVGD